MRKASLLFLMVFSTCMVQISSLYAQQIVRINRPYALMDVQAKDNVKIGKTYKIYRWSQNKPVVTGEIKALVFRNQYCAFKIVKEDSKHPIRVGDWLLAPGKALPKEAAGPSADKAPATTSVPTIQANRSQRWMTYTSIGAGVVCGGLAIYFDGKAGDSADKANQFAIDGEDEAKYLKNKNDTKSYERMSNVFTGFGVGLVALGGLHYYLTRNNVRVEAGPVAIAPTVNHNRPGVGLAFALK